ncbi:MAG: N-formylglutamate amidohydrolase [Marinovum sp.]|nr:N-formylglutamate amidohydrolase [Marinovum sp.]
MGESGDSAIKTTSSYSSASFAVSRAEQASRVLVVCEHATSHIPPEFNQLGLSDDVANSHVAWDPGALPVAERMAEELDAVLFYGTMSRLLYDCNRPPEAPSAIPARSEVFDIPGNANLTQAVRAARVAQVYTPFSTALSDEISRHRETLQLLVTIHSFTPVFHGVKREVEIGILHGEDARFAQAMMQTKPHGAHFCIRLNEPYAADDGVAHTLDQHGHANDLPNVMIEVRNDLIATDADQRAMAHFLTDWVQQALDMFIHGEDAA